jgi:hypothetical protein
VRRSRLLFCQTKKLSVTSTQRVKPFGMTWENLFVTTTSSCHDAYIISQLAPEREIPVRGNENKLSSISRWRLCPLLTGRWATTDWVAGTAIVIILLTITIIWYTLLMLSVAQNFASLILHAFTSLMEKTMDYLIEMKNVTCITIPTESLMSTPSRH